MNQTKILHDIHGIYHSAWGLITVGHNLHGKTVPGKLKPQHRYSQCETITQTTASKIAISSERNTWK